jgi:signal peptidase II
LKKKLLIVSIIVFVILAIDQLVKVYVKSNLSLYESNPILGDWLVMEYIENQGMAFGTKFGSQVWHKLALSIFRIVAIGAITYYWFKQARSGARMEFLIAIGLILAGATGNLIDSMFYDFVFEYNACMPFNELEGSGVWSECQFGQVETRHTGFLMGNVVDMFKFEATWPNWVPWLGGEQVFPAIWNIADASITSGVILVFFRQRKYFPKKKETTKDIPIEEATSTPLEEENSIEVDQKSESQKNDQKE